MTDIRNSLPRNGLQDSPHGNDIRKIVVHHDAQWRSADYDSVARYVSQAWGHINRGEDGLQYHYKVDNVGEIFWCRNHEETLWHCGDYPVNRTSIAICVDGDFTQQTPTREQYQGLKELLDNLCTQHPEFPADEGQVFTHKDFAATACPGMLRDFIVQYRNTGTATPIPEVPYNDGTMGNTTPIPQPPIVVTPPPVIPPIVQPPVITPPPAAGNPTDPVPPVEEVPVEPPKQTLLEAIWEFVKAIWRKLNGKV
jgi:hypothetical protein